MEQGGRDVLGPGEDRAQDQAQDASGVQVHRDGQLGVEPAAGDRFHREHVQPGGVQDHVLAGPVGAQPSQHTLGSLGHRASLLGRTESVTALVQLPQAAVGDRLGRDGCPGMMLEVERVRLCQHRLHRRVRPVLEGIEHLQARGVPLLRLHDYAHTGRPRRTSWTAHRRRAQQDESSEETSLPALFTGVDRKGEVPALF